MKREFLNAKIHQAEITEANLNYYGSLSIDEDLLEAAGIAHNERIHVFNINNGARFETYALRGERGSGIMGLNGAAARLGEVGDKIIIVTYCYLHSSEIESHQPKILLMGERNKIDKIIEG